MIDASSTPYLTLPGLLKATPREEDGRRYVYLEASNEVVDQQGERVLTDALADSADYFLQYGNLDIDHITQLGPRLGIADYNSFEIGRPLAVRIDGARTLVKGEIFRGNGSAAQKANDFWASLTQIEPPQRWYPSIGGTTLEKGADRGVGIIRRIRWTNIGFSKTPANQKVPTVSTVPFGALAKCWTPAGLDLAKALEAGYGTDVATLTGGGALRIQSLDPALQSYWDFRDRLAGDIRRGTVAGQERAALIDHAIRHYGLRQTTAAKWVTQFGLDLAADIHRGDLNG